MVSDFVLILAAGGVFWQAGGDSSPLTWLQALTVALVVAISFNWMMQWTGSYRVERYGQFWRPMFDLLRAFVPSATAAAVILAAFTPRWATLFWFEAWTGAIFVTLLAGRKLNHLFLVAVDHRALLRRRVIIVGSGSLCDIMTRQIQSARYLPDYELVGVFDHRRPQLEGERVGPLTMTNSSGTDLTTYAQNYAVDLVVIALPWEQSAEIFALMRGLQWLAADVIVPFDSAGFRPQFIPPVGFIDTPVLQVMHRPFKGTQGLVKRVEDYVIAVIGLLLCSPFLLFAAIAIKLDDGGPIFFSQPRVGFNSKPFMMFKFRTMTVDPGDDGSAGTKRDSQRITRIGKFLRRSSIDELPQLVNVLRGEMSIVGPRPHVANMLVGSEVYTEVVRQYAARHRIKPGITGWAQINGMRGGINSLAKATRGADLDLHYVANWSLRFDVRIMVRTIFGGLFGRDVF